MLHYVLDSSQVLMQRFSHYKIDAGKLYGRGSHLDLENLN